MAFIEDPSKRTRTSRTYAQGAQKKWVGGPVIHYESVLDSGLYDAEVNFNPVQINNAQFDGWRITNAEYNFFIGDQKDGKGDGWIGFGGRQGSNWIGFKLQGIRYIHWPTRGITDIAGAPDYDRTNITSTLEQQNFDGTTITTAVNIVWGNLWVTPGGGQLSLDVNANSNRLKLDVNVNQAARDWVRNNKPPTTPANETYFSLVLEMDWSDVPKLIKNGAQKNLDTEDFDDLDRQPIELRDAVDNLLAIMPIDYLIAGTQDFETTGIRADRVPLVKRLYKTGGKYYLVIGIRVDELNGLKAGPLLFDPTWGATDATHAGMWWQTYGYYTNYGGLKNSLGKRFQLTDIMFRWGNITIPNGDTIDAATFDIDIVGGITNTVTGDIGVNDVDNPANANADPRTWANTSSGTISWLLPNASGVTTSPDIKTLIQDRISNANWSSGEAIRIGMVENGSAASFKEIADNGATNPPALTITYTAGGGGGATGKSNPLSGPLGGPFTGPIG